MMTIQEKKKYPILIVDDEKDIIKSLMLYLADYSVDYANNAKSALEKLKEGKYKIVMTDIVMPGIDGIEMLRQIKNMRPDIQVIMMTGQTTLMRAAESMQEGAVTYLLKPFEDIRLVDNAIEEAIRRLKEWKSILSQTSKSKQKRLKQKR